MPSRLRIKHPTRHKTKAHGHNTKQLDTREVMCHAGWRTLKAESGKTLIRKFARVDAEKQINQADRIQLRLQMPPHKIGVAQRGPENDNSLVFRG